MNPEPFNRIQSSDSRQTPSQSLTFVEASLLGQQQRDQVLAHRLLQAAAPIVWTARADGIITFLGQQWTETDLSLGQQPGFSFLTTVHPEDAPQATAAWQESVQQRRLYQVELRLKCINGSYRRYIARAEPALCLSHETVGWPEVEWLGTFTDVEFFKDFESGQEGTQLFLATLLENLSDSIIACDVNGVVTAFNRVSQEFHGLPVDPLPPDQWAKHFNLHHPDGKTLLQSEETPLFRAFQGESVRDIKLTIVPKQGGLRTMLASGFPIYDREGQQQGAVVVMRDITDAEQTEAALRQSECRFRAIFNQTFEFIALLELDGTLIEANQTALDYVGFSVDQLIGQLIWKQPWWADLAEIQPQLQQGVVQAIQGKWVRYELEILSADRHRLTFDFLLKPIHDAAGHIIFLVLEGRDITERKQAYAEIDHLNATLEQRVAERTVQLEDINRQNEALLVRERLAKTEVEEALTKLELINFEKEVLLERELLARTEVEAAITEVRSYTERLDLATDAAKLGLWDLDCSTKKVLWNHHHELIFGYESGQPERTYLDWVCRVHPEDLERVQRETRQARDEQKDFAIQYRIVWPDGSVHWITTLGRYYYDLNGQPQRMIGALFDITNSKAAEKALRESEERYRTLVESTSSIVWDANVVGEFSAEQSGWSAFTGQVYDELKGWGWLQAIHPADRADTAQAWSTAVTRRIPYEIEHRLRRYDGEYRDMRVKAVPILETDGSFREWIGIHTDITEQQNAKRALEESEQQFRATFDKAAVGIAHIGLDGRWLRVNQTLCQVVGYSESEISALTFLDITHPDDLSVHCDGMERILRGEIETYSLEKRYIHKSGAIVWVEITVSLVRQLNHASPEYEGHRGDPKYFIAVIEEIGERKQVQNALQDRAEELTNLNVLISQAAALLEHRNQELDQFVHIVSHDLKAPLRAISNLSEWIESDLEGQLPLDSQQQLKLLRARAKRMEAMINSLLVYARAGRQEAPSETFNVAELLTEIIDSLDPPQDFTVHIHLPMPTLTTKRLFLSQVFTNLMSNAIKHHTSSDGKLTISASETPKYYEFMVKDDGPGIAPENHEKIFAIFQTLKAQNSSENTGVGLAIVKKIIESEEGTIRLESNVGKGTAFYFTWPKL